MRDFNPNKNYFMDTWYQYLVADENRLALVDLETTYTRKEVEQLSGKIYNYLKSKGIGKGDFVLADLPRSSKMIIVLLGINKAGAAFIATEGDLAKERKDYIYLNTGSKMVINESVLEEIKDVEYIRGFEPVDLHDVAFAIYTSGTTGTPKGVVHEFGEYEMLVQSICDPKTGILRENTETRFLNIAPFNFVAFEMIFALAFYSGGIAFTPDYSVIKNIRRLLEYMNVNKITETFFSPSILRLIGDRMNPDMQLVYTGSEPANNVSINNGELYNLYMMSETGFVLCQNKLAEPMAIAPVGKPNNGIELSLSENNEIICYNPYCRGYINDPESEAFKDGHYNTGDVAELNEEGQYVLKGRNADTIKINGNRVEPMEVEMTATKVLGGLPCAVKGFTRNNQNYLCLYYASETELDRQTIVDKLEEYLPYYMIPSHYIRVDALPKTMAGKLNRNALKEPAAQIEQKEFVAPRTETEKKFCEVFQKVLNVEKIGVTTDLFEIGLNSIATIEAITMIDMDDITSKTIYQERTVEKISAYYDSVKDAYLTQEEKELEGRKHLYPLNTLNRVMVLLAKMMPGSTAYNMSFALKFGKIINPEKLRDAINTITDNSMFKVTLVEDAEGNALQKYSPELYKPVQIEYLDEDEVEELKKTFVQPFNIFGELPYRIRLIKTKKNLYFFFDIHHYLTDGMGIKTIGDNVALAYRGKEISKFNYFAYCYDYQKIEERQEFQQNVPKVIERFYGKDYGGQPFAEGDEVAYVNQEYNTNVSIKKLNKLMGKNMVTRTTVLYSAVCLYLAKYNKKAKNAISWMYANREPNRNQAGMLSCSLLAGPVLDKKMKLKDVFVEVENELNISIKQMTSSMFLGKLNEVSDAHALGVDDLSDIEEINPMFTPIASKIELERPCDVIPGVPLGYTNLNFFDRAGNIWLRLVTDNSRIKKSARDEMLNDVSMILGRVIDGDESVVQECLNF